MKGAALMLPGARAGAQDNWPQMDVTCLDLSPYYLAEARANLARWARLRAPGLAMGGVDGNGAAFLQAAAETIPQPDASFDAVRAPFPRLCITVAPLPLRSVSSCSCMLPAVRVRQQVA